MFHFLRLTSLVALRIAGSSDPPLSQSIVGNNGICHYVRVLSAPGSSLSFPLLPYVAVDRLLPSSLYTRLASRAAKFLLELESLAMSASSSFGIPRTPFT